ncbi:hypothetical protein COB55_05175 [Candidatus Wolfebacteria bacterium]|nr:MAG: hypothetical protein COB55_05175 [Candidatus Wolfebacteria bacterium]
MSFVNQTPSPLISSRLTTVGRKLLSSGSLVFTSFSVADSEIDYGQGRDLDPIYDHGNNRVLSPFDVNPDLKYKIPQLEKLSYQSQDFYQPLPTLVPVENEITNTAKQRGFFSGTPNNYSAFTFQSPNDPLRYLHQADAVLHISGVTGGTSMRVYSASTFTGGTQPGVQDYALIEWRNPSMSGLTRYTNNRDVVNIPFDQPIPWLWYKIEAISGDLATSGILDLTLDRDILNFHALSGATQQLSGESETTLAGVYFYPSGNSIDTFYGSGETTQYWNEDTLAFNNTSNLANDELNIWNMNIVHTETIAGNDLTTFETHTDYGSTGYTGIKNYLGYTFDKPEQKAIGIIHYTNHSISNFYGESLHKDTIKLHLPTIMWHHNDGTTLGLELSNVGETKKNLILGDTLDPSNTNSGLTTTYYDLTDSSGNTVGKVLNDLKTIIIHDEELLAAMSYKSNRNWSLPTLEGNAVSVTSSVGTNVFSPQTQQMWVSYLFENFGTWTGDTTGTPTNLGTTNGIHCQNYTLITGDTNQTPTPGVAQVRIPLGELPYMRSVAELETLSGTGWNANVIKLICQRTALGQRPKADSWRFLDVTSGLTNFSTTELTSIDPDDLDGSANQEVFNITKELFDSNSGNTYVLNDLIQIPTSSQPDNLQFGDEVFFFGNIETDIQAISYKTKFVLPLGGSQYNASINPTFRGDTSVFVSDIGIYDNSLNLVAVGKLNKPIEKKVGKTVIIELSIDF